MLKRETNTPEGRKFWAAVEQSVREVARMPSWASVGVSLTRSADEDDLRRPCTPCEGTGAYDCSGTLCPKCFGSGRVW